MVAPGYEHHQFTVEIQFTTVPGDTGLDVSRLFLTAARGTSHPTSAGKPHRVTMGIPVLVEFARSIPISARLLSFNVGTPAVATVTAVQ